MFLVLLACITECNMLNGAFLDVSSFTKYFYIINNYKYLFDMYCNNLIKRKPKGDICIVFCCIFIFTSPSLCTFHHLSWIWQYLSPRQLYLHNIETFLHPCLFGFGQKDLDIVESSDQDLHSHHPSYASSHVLLL